MHYWLTSARAACDCVLELGELVVDADDGRLTPAKWSSRKPAGLALRYALPPRPRSGPWF